MVLEVIYFTGWFAVTLAVCWQLHIDNRRAQESLERITEMSRDVARFLGTERQ